MAVRKTGLDVVRIAQMQAPVDTGNLRASIGMTQTGPASVEVGPTVHYGAYVEYGTYKMAAQPYMSPAADAAIPGLIEALSTLGIDAIGG
nr:MAG TPA: putative tail component [Caudoviricetes sp.]